MIQIRPIRAVVAGILGGLAASFCIFILFRLIGFQYWGILVNPQYQSQKLIKVWTELEPIPLAVSHPEIITLGFIVLAVIHACVFSVIERGIPGEGWKKGVSFGLVIWAFSYLFFEFFTPWNMFGEPVSLVILELLFWIPVALSEGIVIAKTYGD